jgi:hypothetical protein
VNQINLILDEDDARSVREAMEQRRAFICGIPDGNSNDAGAVIAEICRGWMEMLDAAKGK